jgi:hypothetical protein
MLVISPTTRTLALWTSLWLVTTAMATFIPFQSLQLVSLHWVSILLNLLVGLKMIQTNVQYIRSLDELMQKIHMEAMAITLGLSVVVGIAYSLLDITNLISMDSEISFLVMFIGLTYISMVAYLQKKFS